jgi:hypothetical protein
MQWAAGHGASALGRYSRATAARTAPGYAWGAQLAAWGLAPPCATPRAMTRRDAAAAQHAVQLARRAGRSDRGGRRRARAPPRRTSYIHVCVAAAGNAAWSTVLLQYTQ